jgi:adenine deaminase
VPKIGRRQFVRAAAASAVTLSRVSRALAAAVDKYDLIIRGGRVIDPSSRLDAIRDVAISEGRIAAVNANIAADAVETIDARGKSSCPACSTFIRMSPAPQRDLGSC